VRSVLFYVLLVAGLALLIISGLFMSLSCLSNVKEKTKEIAVLRSLGIPQKSVSSVFVIENCFLAIVSSLVGLFLGWLFIFGINQAFMDAEVFGISYSLLFSSPLAYFLGIQGALAIALSATIPPIKKANEIDIASTLRSL
jgi:lipoprotein-releasing system permease protein